MDTLKYNINSIDGRETTQNDSFTVMLFSFLPIFFRRSLTASSTRLLMAAQPLDVVDGAVGRHAAGTGEIGHRLASAHRGGGGVCYGAVGKLPNYEHVAEVGDLGEPAFAIVHRVFPETM